jgi:hypothetical protein
MAQCMDNSEQQFEEAMWNIYEEAKRPPCRYNAGYFRKMLIEYGGRETARRLLQTIEVQEGFTELYLCNRIDLTVEFHVLQPRFRGLFTSEERQAATQRLTSVGFAVDDEGDLIHIAK